jgi:hypothetical protein
VWIENLKRVLPKGSLLPVPLACSVEFGPALTLQPEESRADFLARARAALLALRRDIEPAPEATAGAGQQTKRPSEAA